MSPPRLSLLAAAVAAGVLAGPATGAGRVCHLVTDPTGDASHFAPDNPTVNAGISTDLDVVSADVATNKRWLTAVIRTATLTEDPDQMLPSRHWEMAFAVGEHHYTIDAHQGVDGFDASFMRDGVGTEDEKAGVVFDYANREVRMTVPLTAFPGLSAKQPVRAIAVRSGHQYGTSGGQGYGAAGYGAHASGGSGMSSSVDTASTKRTYAPGTASCVAVGR